MNHTQNPPGSTPRETRTDEQRRTAARVLYESVPAMTMERVAAEVGATLTEVQTWKRQDGDWQKAHQRTRGMSALANEAADRMEVATAATPDLPVPEVAHEVAEELGVDLRARVLSRHRKEWNAPRGLIYKAMRDGDEAMAKLAKVSAETLTLIQAGETKAYGINPKDQGETIVVVERSE